MRFVRKEGWEGFLARRRKMPSIRLQFFEEGVNIVKDRLLAGSNLCFYITDLFLEIFQVLFRIHCYRYDADGTVLLENVQFIAFGKSKLCDDFFRNCDL